jgi:hypothetical protein
MKTFCYLLDDEANPPQLWEIIGQHAIGLAIVQNAQDPSQRLLVKPENVWEIASF